VSTKALIALLKSAKSDIELMLTSYPLYADMKRQALSKIDKVIEEMKGEK